MQQTKLSRTVRYLAAILVMVNSLALVACSSDDDQETRNVAATVPLSATTVVAVQGQAFTFSNGSIFSAGIGNNPVTLTFNTPTTFTLTRTGGATSTGNVLFGSCQFNVTAPATGGLIAVGTAVNFPTCNLVIGATGVPVGGDGVSGTATLTLSGPTGSGSSSITVTVTILEDGTLVINGVVTNVDTDVTGTTGSTGG